MISPSNSSGNSLLPNEARWDELTSHLPGSVEELGLWVDDSLAALEDRFASYVTRKSLKKDLRSDRQHD